MSHHHERHDLKKINVGVLTISDTRTVSTDVSGDTIIKLCTQANHSIVSRAIVRDEITEIRTAVTSALQASPQLIVTTGGTGLTLRDVTIEAIEPLLDKKLDGFGEAFRRISWEQIGPKSMLSRALAGSCKHTLIVALPGSIKAVELAMVQLVLPIVGHAAALLS